MSGLVKLAELSRLGRSPQLPMTLQLPVGELKVSEWLRVLPGRRYVARAAWRDRPVLAKLLVGGKAHRHFRRERSGVTCLKERQIDTPELLASDYRAGEGGWLLFAFLDGAESLGQKWLAVAAEPSSVSRQQEILEMAARAIGSLHARGVWQEDLHLDNLLCRDNRLYWIDGDSVRATRTTTSLPVSLAADNLGLFLAQLPTACDAWTPHLLVAYTQAGGTVGMSLDVLQRAVAKQRRRRLHDYLAKTGRECSLFSARRSSRQLLVVCRDQVEILGPLLADPDRYIEAGVLLKKGGSATVARVELNGRSLLVKRYNIKGVRHWLRRFWRPSRAWHAWREGHRLRFLGLATPRPLAVLEQRCCWLRRRAYLVTDYLDGPNLVERMASLSDDHALTTELTALHRLFDALCRERISHGDLKGSNLIRDGEHWALIDLDAMRQHRSAWLFRRACRRDRSRLLRNWSAESPLYRRLDALLPPVDDSTH
ncbi:MAG: lipopolysaccharide kinase InaA family protein [Desulfuromonadales bacterium]|nr:lipopolysaccharide kinase InaA family protein [Desulfuromonadales bacterium]